MIQELDVGDVITLTIGSDSGETSISGSVKAIDTYTDKVEPERVVHISIRLKLDIDGGEWEAWKAYLIEEPAGEYRVNVMQSDGSGSRTVHFPRVESFSFGSSV